MNLLDNILASPPGVRLLLRKLHLKGRLAPLIREVLADGVVQEQARQAGIAITADELQNAADSFRRRHGTHTAADTQAWLSARGLSVDDFEAGLEESLLAAKVRNHVTVGQVDQHWQAHQADYERLRLEMVTVGREELARELASQVRDDGRELHDVVHEHGLTLTRVNLFRKELNGSLADALASAGVGQLVGPVSTARDFVLALIEERRPAELDKDTRRYIQNELFEAWLAEQLKRATLPPHAAEIPG
ncbi:MAG: peptidyl-prolyl cis-trans isomerase [Planctomycetes bacterium]|nr:peptidyl-prolyl cis-trans isomerase [Planctomycetota bacterium]